jgi:hypothetical protein
MDVEERLRNKRLYKIELLLLKIIPILMAVCSACNSILSYFDIEVVIINYIGGVSLLPFIFLYLSSYVFKFCAYHRMFLHYLLITDIINIYDYHIGIPLNNLEYLCLHMIITIISIFIVLYLYMNRKKKNKVY